MKHARPILIAAGAVAGAAWGARTLVRRRRYLPVRDRVVLITGGSRGLGLQLARTCALRGARIVICARDERELGRAHDELALGGADVLAVQCDVTVKMKDNIYVTTVVPGLMRTGSPRNALFKGRHREEYAWFSTADVMPLLSIDPARVANRVVDAAEHGDAELILPLAARIQARLHGLFPGITAELSGLINRFLPGPGGIGTARATGAESQSTLQPEFARARNEQAAEAHNEM